MPDGVPTFAKFGAKRRRAYLKNLREGMTKTAAAEDVGVSAELVRLYRRRTPGWEDQEETAEMEGCNARSDKAESALMLAAESGNVRACETILYNLRPHRWKNRRTNEITGPDGEPLAFQLVESIEVTVVRGNEPTAEPQPIEPGPDRPALSANGAVH
jgi:hypothetical protein